MIPIILIIVINFYIIYYDLPFWEKPGLFPFCPPMIILKFIVRVRHSYSSSCCHPDGPLTDSTIHVSILYSSHRFTAPGVTDCFCVSLGLPSVSCTAQFNYGWLHITSKSHNYLEHLIQTNLWPVFSSLLFSPFQVPRDGISPCSSGWPKIRSPPVLASPGLGLQGLYARLCDIMPVPTHTKTEMRVWKCAFKGWAGSGKLCSFYVKRKQWGNSSVLGSADAVRWVFHHWL